MKNQQAKELEAQFALLPDDRLHEILLDSVRCSEDPDPDLIERPQHVCAQERQNSLHPIRCRYWRTSVNTTTRRTEWGKPFIRPGCRSLPPPYRHLAEERCV
jgi:hypothetical protein